MREQFLPPHLVAHLPLIGTVRMVMLDHPCLSEGLLRIPRGWPSHPYGRAVVRRLYVIWENSVQLEISKGVLLPLETGGSLSSISFSFS